MEEWTKKCMELLDISIKDRVAFVNSFDIVITDCDGVIWSIAEPIPRAGTAIQLFKEMGKQVKFLSNNSMRNDDGYLQKLSESGIKNVEPEDIVYPAKTMASHINKFFRGKPVFSLCSTEMNEILAEYGVNIQIMEPQTLMHITNIETHVLPKNKMAAVLMDINFNLTYGELARAQQYLTKNSDCALIVGASDPIIPVKKNVQAIGSAGFINMIQQATGVEPVITGKPGQILREYMLETFNIKKPHRVLLIGDNLEMDIAFGCTAGFQTLLVLTGTSTREEVYEQPESERPHFLARSVADFIRFFSDLKDAY